MDAVNENEVDERIDRDADEFEQFQRRVEEPTVREASANNNFDMNAIMTTMNMMIQQNGMMLQMLNQNQGTQSYNIMPDFSKTISQFNGEDLTRSKAWLSNLESTAMLHRWPPEFILETARMHLTGAAQHWYEAHKGDINTWNDFKYIFKNTFVQEENLAALWKNMTSRIQGQREDLSLYFHEKIKLCKQLNLTFAEQKEQIAIGLVSREMSTLVMTKNHRNSDELYHDLVSYERMVNERKGRLPIRQVPGPSMSYSRGNVPARRPTTEPQTSTFVPRTPQSRGSVRCFNCQEEGHIVTSCPKPRRERGSCFQCGQMGHRVKECPQRKPKQEVSSPVPDATVTLIEEKTPQQHLW